MPQRKVHLDRSIKQAANGVPSVMRGQFDWPRPDPADDRLVYLRINGIPVGRVRRSELETELGRQEAAYVKASQLPAAASPKWMSPRGSGTGPHDVATNRMGGRHSRSVGPHGSAT